MVRLPSKSPGSVAIDQVKDGILPVNESGHVIYEPLLIAYRSYYIMYGIGINGREWECVSIVNQAVLSHISMHHHRHCDAHRRHICYKYHKKLTFADIFSSQIS